METAAIIVATAILILCGCFGFERITHGIDILKHGREGGWDIEFEQDEDDGEDEDPADYWKK